MAQVLLHGVLHVTIYEVDKLSGENCFTYFCKVLSYFPWSLSYYSSLNQLLVLSFSKLYRRYKKLFICLFIFGFLSLNFFSAFEECLESN